MKSIQIFFLSLILFCNISWASELVKDEIRYAFSLSEKNELKIIAEFLGDESGQTKVIMPWNTTHFQLIGEGFTYDIKDGANVTESKLGYTTFAHHPSAKFKVKYSFGYNKSINYATWPIIDNTFFSFYLPYTLIYPDTTPLKNKKLTFDFSALDEKYRVFTSYGEQKKLTVEDNLQNLTFSQFIGTTKPVTVSHIKEQPIHIIENGQWNYFFEKSASSILLELIEYQRNEMGDHDFPYYFVSIIQQPNESINKTVSGLHNRNSLLLFFPDGPKNKLPRIKYVMSHEIFHAWLGNKVQIPLSLALQYRWFYEGFTDYFAFHFARKGKFLDLKELAELLNIHVKDYYTSIYHTISNELYTQLNGAYGMDFNFIQTRGNLLALWFSKMLKEKKMDESTIKNFVKEIVNQTHYKNKLFSESIFWEAFNKYFDSDFKDLIEKHIIKGEGMTLPPIEGLKIKEEKFSVIVPGFDIVESLKVKKIIHLQESSPAFKAGLRSGAKYVDHKIERDSEDKVKIFVIQSVNGKREQVIFEPEIKERLIPQYIPA